MYTSRDRCRPPSPPEDELQLENIRVMRDHRVIRPSCGGAMIHHLSRRGNVYSPRYRFDSSSASTIAGSSNGSVAQNHYLHEFLVNTAKTRKVSSTALDVLVSFERFGVGHPPVTWTLIESWPTWHRRRGKLMPFTAEMRHSRRKQRQVEGPRSSYTPGLKLCLI